MFTCSKDQEQAKKFRRDIHRYKIRYCSSELAKKLSKCYGSIIVPIYNGENWIDKCFKSILSQSAVKDGTVLMEVVAFNDASSDRTREILENWNEAFSLHKIKYTVVSSERDSPNGVGAAKNASIKESSGRYLCFQDVDDIMLPRRVQLQFEAAKQMHNSLIGSKFVREPAGSTARFTEWANNLELEKLGVQVYTSHGPTVIMPTWFCHRSVYDRVGGFIEGAKGTPEDLIFFMKHLQLGGEVFRVDETLLIYTYHANAATFSVLSETIWNIRINTIQEDILNKWPAFIIWNAGKQGRKFLRSLAPSNQDKVVALCDVDPKKVGTSYRIYCEQSKKFIKTFPIIYFRDAVPPIVICVKMGLTNGDFEANLKSMNLTEGSDYILFC